MLTVSTSGVLIASRPGTGRQPTQRTFAFCASEPNVKCSLLADCKPKAPLREAQQTVSAEGTPGRPAGTKSTSSPAATGCGTAAVEGDADENIAPQRVPSLVAASAADASATGKQCALNSSMPRPSPRVPHPAMEAPHKAGTGRVASKRTFVIDITALERAESQWRAKLAAAAEASFARAKAEEQAAVAAAAAKAAAEAEALRRAADAAAAAARAAAEAEAAAKAAAEAEAAERAAAEQAAAEAAALAAAEAARQAEAEAEAAAAAEAAEAAAAEAAAAAAAVDSVAKTPGLGTAQHSDVSVSQWSPIEGVPELHTRMRPVRHMAALPACTPAATPAALFFTPVEGVPETAMGFRRPQPSAGPGLRARVVFTPVEGVPEKAMSFQRTPVHRQLQAAGQHLDQQLQEAAAAASVAMTPAAVPAQAAAAVTGGDKPAGQAASLLSTGAHTGPSRRSGAADSSPNTPCSQQLPVGLASTERTGGMRAAAAAAVDRVQRLAAAVPSVTKVAADKPGFMDVAVQYSASRLAAAARKQQELQDAEQEALLLGEQLPGDAAATAGIAAAAAAAAETGITPTADATQHNAAAVTEDNAMVDDDAGDDYAGAGAEFDAGYTQDNSQQHEPADAAAAAANTAAWAELLAAQAAAAGAADAAVTGGVDKATPEHRLPAAGTADAAAAAEAYSMSQQQAEEHRVSVAMQGARDRLGSMVSAGAGQDAAAMDEPADAAAGGADSDGDAQAEAAAADAQGAADSDSGSECEGEGGPAAAAAAAGTAHSAASKKRKAGTPFEGRRAKQRKSLLGEGLTYGPDGRRTSSRVHCKPLEWYRNEHKEYARTHKSLPTVSHVVNRTPDPIWPAPDGVEVKKARTKPHQEQQEGGQGAAAKGKGGSKKGKR